MAPRQHLGLAIVVVVVLSACTMKSVPTSRKPRARPSSTTSSTAAPRSKSSTPPLQWHQCDQGDCATLTVPLDPAQPEGPTIGLAVARASQAKDGRRIGSLLVNPGGPGASGLDIVKYISSNLPAEITDRFDIVSWDPRGSGKSAPVRCGNQLDYLFDIDTSPDDPGELATLEAGAKRFVDACVAKTGDRLRHISTADTVADLEQLRAALGDDKLTYLGLSYGTYIGGLYAATYPDHVRALVLDGALDPQRSTEDVAVEQAKGFDASLAEFFGWCTDHDSCVFHHDGDPRAEYEALARRVDEKPIGDGDTRFGPTQLDIAVAALLYSGASGYRMLADGLHDLERGATAGLRAAADLYLGRSGADQYDDEWAAFIAISCADGPNLTVAATEALQRRAAAEAPDFGAGNVGLGYECSYWPYPPTRNGPVTFSAPTAPPIVVVGTRGDPATPIAWARGLAAQLGSGRLVTVDDTTHTASLNGNKCVDSILTRYFVDLDPPPPGATC